jgi:hypothetical protein
LAFTFVVNAEIARWRRLAVLPGRAAHHLPVVLATHGSARGRAEPSLTDVVFSTLTITSIWSGRVV